MRYLKYMPVPEAAQLDRRLARVEVFDRLRAWIEDGQLEPGEVIKDVDLASALGVSRTPVREALQMLEQHGLVETRPGRLTRVTEITFEDAVRVYAPLAALEALAAELGTPEATPAAIDELRLHNADLLAATKARNPSAAREADRRFHGVLLRLADNPYLTAAIEPLLVHIRRLEALYFRGSRPGRDSYLDHKRIISAVAAGDAAAARAATQQNFQRYWNPSDHEDPDAHDG
jgi:DNA-binding GntR family transcriptional regulator